MTALIKILTDQPLVESNQPTLCDQIKAVHQKPDKNRPDHYPPFFCYSPFIFSPLLLRFICFCKERLWHLRMMNPSIALTFLPRTSHPPPCPLHHADETETDEDVLECVCVCVSEEVVGRGDTQWYSEISFDPDMRGMSQNSPDGQLLIFFWKKKTKQNHTFFCGYISVDVYFSSFILYM